MTWRDTRAARLTVDGGMVIMEMYWFAVLWVLFVLAFVVLMVVEFRRPIAVAILAFVLWLAWRTPGWAEVFGL